MEHIELAGVHSGDSACIIPSKNISEENVKTIKEYTRKIAEEMHVKGLMNMQYAIENGKVYVLEANPRCLLYTSAYKENDNEKKRAGEKKNGKMNGGDKREK